MSLLVRVYLMTGILLISTSHLSESVAQCGTCVASSCSPPVNCLAGRVKDSCDCCYVCGRKEGERCDHKDVQSSQQFGRCGDTLQCRVRTDLDPYDPKEAVCFCSQNAPLCGSDGVTYENVCQLTEARYVRRNGLAAMYMGPCRKAPRISTPPLNVRNITGSRVALMCEAIGWPSPDMAWSKEMQNGTTSELPGTLTHIGVHSTSGPGHGEVTNWLLFSRLKADDDATYICSAENDLGKVTARARIYVINR